MRIVAHCTRQFQSYFYVFFLEDLLLRLNELSVDLIYAKSEALSKYLSELLAIQGILKAQIKK